MKLRVVSWILLSFAALAGIASSAEQLSLRGRAVDDSGAVVPGAKITLTNSGGSARSTTSANNGAYTFDNLQPGEYSINASAPDLAMRRPLGVSLAASQTLDLPLQVVLADQKLEVQENAAPSVDTSAAANASALILRGSDLDALSDNPDDLAADLQALAGPSAGPNGGAIFVDGFSGGQLPPKESIREIRINQNPFSPEYDKLGLGRIEIFTKPGTDKFRGTVFYNFGDDFWNSRNPYAAQKAPFLLKEYGGNLSGPLNGRASFFLDIQRHAVDNGAIINGATLDPATLAIIDPYTGVLSIPQRRVMISPRVDYQINESNTLVARYSYNRTDIQDSGVGGFNLPSRGSHAEVDTNTVQLTETAVLGSAVINETRFQFFGAGSSNTANSQDPAIQVLGAFNGGGAQTGHSTARQNLYELQNATSIARAAHTLRFGVRLRGETEDSVTPRNFGGTYTFGGGNGITSLERYRLTSLYQRQGLPFSEIRALGGGPTQHSFNTGDPALAGGQFDAGFFAGDEWRSRPNLTVSLGLRYETQTNIHDLRDWAPRAGIAWAPGAKSGKTKPASVVRVGFGMFYDRFSLANTLTALRYDGVHQQQVVIADPDYFLSGGADFYSLRMTTLQKISSTLRAPYIMQGALAYERQLPGHTTTAVTYAVSHGLHAYRSQVSGLNPTIYLMESAGLYNQHQLIVNVNSRVTNDVSVFGSYVFNRAMSNTDGLTTFPSKPGDFSGEYGPASTDIHHRMTFGGSINTLWNVRLSPLFIVESGPPFDITAGRDLYGDTLFNARPGIATDPNKSGVIRTPYGLLDPNPDASERILPRNFGRGPGQVMLNLRVAKTFAFGTREGAATAATSLPGDGRRQTAGVFSGGSGSTSFIATNKRYSFSVSMAIRNLLNHNNPGAIIGNITSPLFGLANQAAGTPGGGGFSEAANNRRLELQTRFTF